MYIPLGSNNRTEAKEDSCPCEIHGLFWLQRIVRSGVTCTQDGHIRIGGSLFDELLNGHPFYVLKNKPTLHGVITILFAVGGEMEDRCLRKQFNNILNSGMFSREIELIPAVEIQKILLWDNRRNFLELFHRAW